MESRASAQGRGNSRAEPVQKLFAGRTLVIASMHGKEKVLKPLLEHRLAVNVIVARGLNTDQFGTFSGEVKRMFSPLDTARLKCDTAKWLTSESLVVASEGSFGAHPVLGFVPVNEELLLFRDYKEAFEISAKVTSLKTNFSGQAFVQWADVVAFAAKAGFPSHGLMVRSGHQQKSEVHKGIHRWERLKKSFLYFRNTEGQAFVETDMRAHHNPTRMKVIGEAARKLVAVIMNPCPCCKAPGFAVTEVKPGLPCGLCGAPTAAVKAHLYTCAYCGYNEVKDFPDTKQYEDPLFCSVCNP